MEVSTFFICRALFAATPAIVVRPTVPGIGAKRRRPRTDPARSAQTASYPCGVVSDQDRQKMRRLARDLADGESSSRGTAEQRRAILHHINADRLRQGREPLEDRAPEEGLYDRARSLGMARIDR